MASEAKSKIADVFKKYEVELFSDWMKAQVASLNGSDVRIQESELRDQCRSFLRAIQQASQTDHENDIDNPAWQEVRELLEEISRKRGNQGFSPSETATFVFSFKQPLIARLRKEHGSDADGLADDNWRAMDLLDKLGLFTTEVYQKSREDMIARQQQEMLELSTPVVKLWEGVLALPLIGTLDSARTQVVMESLLQRIVETEAELAIIDITGVPTVDTLVAQHLIKTVTAARLMGADCIISGIRPQIAQTIVHLGVDLANVTTKASLADAFQLALRRGGFVITRTQAQR